VEKTQEVRAGIGIAAGWKTLAHAENKLYSAGVMHINMKSDKIILIVGVVLLAALALKSLRQMIFLSFTLLSLKIVWVLLIVLYILTLFRKHTRSSRDGEK
jgi:hydrogenase/urease accessory protein HupE